MILPSAGVGPANENWPTVKLHHVGDGKSLAQVLVRVLVRRALLNEGLIQVPANCQNRTQAG